jgi:hypothetical protein
MQHVGLNAIQEMVMARHLASVASVVGVAAAAVAVVIRGDSAII